MNPDSQVKSTLNHILSAIGLAMAALVLALTGAVAASGASPKNGNGETSTAVRAKARHYYMAGAVADAEGRDAEAYELFKKAFRLDPGYAEASYSFGVARLSNRLDTLATQTELNRSIGMVRRFADKYPSDIQENLYYAYLANYNDPGEAARVYQRVFDLDPKRTSTLLQLAETRIRNREFGKALESLSKYEDIEGESPAISTRKLQLMVQERDTAGARAEADRLVDKYPSDIEYRMLRGSLSVAIGDTAAWERDLRKSEEIEPDNAQVRLSLADLALSRGDSIGFHSEIYKALLSPSLGLDDKRDLLAQYLQHLISNNGETGRGDALFVALEEQYPHQPMLLELEARYRMATGNQDHGIELMEYATSLEPSNLEYWRELMGFGVTAKRWAVTRSAYRKAKGYVRPDENMKFVYALASDLDGHQDEALETYGEMLKEITGTSDFRQPLAEMKPLPRISLEDADRLLSLYTAASTVFTKKKDLQGACETCENALFIAPGDPLTLNNYAYFLAEQGRDLAKALEMAGKAVEAEPENPTYLDTYAWALYKTGDFPKALEYQRQAMEKAGEDAETSEEFHTHLAKILKANGLNAEAKEEEAKAAEIISRKEAQDTNKK